MINKIKVGKSLITNNSETYFIADIAANWDGDIKRAKKLIKLAAKAGANAAKFQNFNAETIISDYGFKTISKGVLDLRDIIFFGSLIVSFIFINCILVELKRNN